MLDKFQDQLLKLPVFIILIVLMLLSFVLLYSFPTLGAIGFVLVSIVAILALQKSLRTNHDLMNYSDEMQRKLTHTNSDAYMGLPIGMLSYNDKYEIEWLNPYLSTMLQDNITVGSHIYDIHASLVPFVNKETKDNTIMIDGRVFRTECMKQQKLLYFIDITQETATKGIYEKQQVAFAIIFLDNYDEITQSLEDHLRSGLNSMITSILNKWAVEHGIYIRRTGSDRFFIVLNKRILIQLEKEKFHILDVVREETTKKGFPLTISMGIGSGTQSLTELGSLAQSSLDLALGRGGDQVCIKDRNGKSRFYGGKTNPVEKRTRVRARVISHALRDLIIESKKVFVMGHKMPDMDSIGSAIAILKVAEANDRVSHLIIDENQVDLSVRRLMNEVKDQPELYKKFLSPTEALELIDQDTLVVIVDTHVPSMVAEPKILEHADKVIVIDHHRRGENFIDDPILVYMEPYASSTAELVTELLEYQPKKMKLSMLEATTLLAGIIVDTKSFTLRTGSRTFEAASYLRQKGADTVLVQKLLKEDFSSFRKKNKLIESTQLNEQGIAIAVGNEEDFYDQVLIAQSADTLLNMTNVRASFVVARKSENRVSISARSLGEINVQVIMEKLNGGGHLTNAATQISDETISEVLDKLKKNIEEYLQEGDIQ